MTREAGIIGIVSTLIAVFVAIFAVVGTPEQAQQLGTLPIVVVTLLVIGAAIFLLGVPLAARSGHPAMVGFVSGLLGLVLVVPAYWSGLPIVLGTAGVLLGQAGRGRGVAVGGIPVALWAIVVGATAVILDLLIFLVDRFT
jgi:hypothetical protein